MKSDLIITYPWIKWKPVAESRGYLRFKPEFAHKVVQVNDCVVSRDGDNLCVHIEGVGADIGVCESSPLAQILTKFTNFFTVQ